MIEQQIEKLKTLQESYDAVATTIEVQLPAIADKIDNIDLTPIENKVGEGVSALSTKIDNIDLSAVENKVQEESAAIQAKIDNIQLPDIDTTELAKQGENPEATNSKILDEVKDVKNTFDALDIPLSAISGLALELEGGKNNIANALKARGIAASAESETLTDMAAKIYEVKNPVAFTVPAETSNDFANIMFNTIMTSQGYDQIYDSVYKTYCDEGGVYVGCLMTCLIKSTSTSINLTGADAYYILEEDIFYKAGNNGNLIQFINGVETQLSTKAHAWNSDNTRSLRTVFYLYLPNSTANGDRENTLVSCFDYCHDSVIPYIVNKSNGAPFIHLHLANPESCVVSAIGTNSRCVYFYSNIERCSEKLSMGAVHYCWLENLKVAENNKQTVINTYAKYVKLPKLQRVYNSILLSNSSNVEELDLSSADELVYLPSGDNYSAIYGNVNIKKLILKNGVIIDNLMWSQSNQLLNKNVVEIVSEEIHHATNKTITSSGKGGANPKGLYFSNLKRGEFFLGSTGSNTNFHTEKIIINCCGGRTDEIKMIHSSNVNADATTLKDIEISEGTRQPLTFNCFKGLLTENIVSHIFERLADNRFEDDGVTPAPAIKITLNSVNLSKLTDEQKAIATDKNYILA